MDNKDYKNRGYSDTFEKSPNERKIPFMSQFDIESYIEGIPGGRINGGIITSIDGKLKIDLVNGHISRTDGTTTTVII